MDRIHFTSFFPSNYETIVYFDIHMSKSYDNFTSHLLGSLPGTVVVHQLMQAIKSKCTPEEAFDIIKDLPNPLKEKEGNQDMI